MDDCQFPYTPLPLPRVLEIASLKSDDYILIGWYESSGIYKWRVIKWSDFLSEIGSDKEHEETFTNSDLDGNREIEIEHGLGKNPVTTLWEDGVGMYSSNFTETRVSSTKTKLTFYRAIGTINLRMV